MSDRNQLLSISEDVLAVLVSLLFLLLSLFPLVFRFDFLGFLAFPSVWLHLKDSLKPLSPSYQGLGGIGSFLLSYVFLLPFIVFVAWTLRTKLRNFLVGFTLLFLFSYLSWIAGSFALVAASSPQDLQKFGLSWSLRLTQDAGFAFALSVGIGVANFFPARLSKSLRPSARNSTSR
jgi:hypothetical protein